MVGYGVNLLINILKSHELISCFCYFWGRNAVLVEGHEWVKIVNELLELQQQ